MVFWNVRTATITTENPAELDVAALIDTMNNDLNMEEKLEEVILTVCACVIKI